MVHLASVSGASVSDAGHADDECKRVEEGRQSCRPLRRKVELKGVGLLSDGTCFSFSVIDMSYDGCSIEAEIALFPGVKFQMSVLGFRGAVNAMVRWHRDGRSGIEFCAEQSPHREQTPRAHERRKIAGSASLRRMGRKEYQTRLFDLTPNGCKVEFIERPRPGELLWVKLNGLSNLEAAVRWVDGFYGGVEFVRPLHEAIFDSLVEGVNA